MQQIFSNTTLTVNQLIEKIDTGELVLPDWLPIMTAI